MNSIRLKEIGRKIIRPSVAVLLVILTACDMPEMKTTNKIAYHFDEPARMWEETLPLGNGRLGMMPDGGINKENILLNEISMWSGSKQDTDNPQAVWSLANIRRLLFEGKNDEAQDMSLYDQFLEGAGDPHDRDVH
mgnify:CR=1 FL=1